MRRTVRPASTLRRVACIAIALALLGGCGDGGDEPDDGTATGATPAPVLEDELALLALPGYAQRGKADPRFDWIGGFERRTGCRVRVETAAGPAELLARLASPGNDIALVPGEMVLTLVASGHVQPVDTGRVPLLAQVGPRLADGAWARLDGVRYAVPFAWRAQGLLYRTDVFPQPPDASALFLPQPLPDREPNAGRVQAIDSPMAIADAAMFLAATQPALGIDDPYALDARQYAAALALVRAQAPLLHRWWSDADAQRKELAHGLAVVASGWAPSAREAAEPGLAWTAPAAGVPAQADASVLATGAKHPQCAYAWLDYSLEPPVQEAMAAWLGAVPANAQACARPLLAPDACARQGAALLPRAQFRRPAQVACGREGGCVPYSRWVEDFHSLRGD